MKTVVIDCREMTDRRAAHEYLARKLSFPEYYGHNLDALHDCLGDISEEVCIVVYRPHEMYESLGQYAEIMADVLRMSGEENPYISVMFESE
ncbi:MAG: barstar family protein [Clostridia bacterium]|nr:barnase inhibitor [Oscillospiraceae bacterium]MBQ6797336.1 barstar family protein [Clostridia bacterium]